VETEVGAMIECEKEVKQIGAAVCLCFFFSGATGLIYEVLWTRMLGLVFGHTVFAITTVLAAFMAGLGLGSYLFGKIADWYPHPLRLYGFLEAGIGVYVLFTPALFSRAEWIYISLHRSLGLSFFAFSLAQFLLIFLILLVPTTLMGATLPVLGRFFVREIAALGEQIGLLYALNTFGAVLGTYAAGFHLIPILGVKRTLLLGAVTNSGIGLLAIVFDRHLRQVQTQPPFQGAVSPDPGPEHPAAGPESGDARGRVGVWLSIVGLGLSGSASMMYEVAWSRTLALVIGSSTYAFSTMLVAFLAGLALGSYLFSRLAGRMMVTPFFFGCLQLGIGLGALVVTPFFDRMPEVFLWAFQLSRSPGFIKALQFSISVLAMFLPTLFMGATFPCVAQIASRDLKRIGLEVGRIYFFNTMGAIAGTILAGFLLIPTWGLQFTLKLAIFLNLSLALILFATSQEARWRRGAAIIPFLAMAALYASPSWDASAMVSGVAIYGRQYFGFLGKADFRQAMASLNRLVFLKDGISATVSVHRKGDNQYIRVNGKTDASNAPDMQTQLMLGHLPLLFHQNPQRILIIGLGSGVTAGAAAVHPADRIDVIEIEPAVVEAAAYFKKENRDVLNNHRVHVAIADGRNFLLSSGTYYDVITSEPSNPWMRGIGNLFSLEFYQLVAMRLAPKGIVCQWIHGYGLFPDDLQMVAKTFRAVFPHTTIWRTVPGDFLLIGSKTPLVLDYTHLLSLFESLPDLRNDLAAQGMHFPLTFLADFVLSEKDTARYAQDALLNTDDLPILEFSAPEALYVDTVDLNKRVMMAFKEQEFPTIIGLPREALHSPDFLRDLGLAFWAKEMPDEALMQFDKALRSDPQNARSLLYRGRAHLRFNSVLNAEADFKTALRLDPRMVEAHEALGQLYKSQKMWELAEVEMRQVLSLHPKDPRHQAALADMYIEGKRPGEAIPLFLSAVALTPQDAHLWTSLGLAYQGAGRVAEALEAFRQALSREPENAFIHYQLGLAYLELKRFDEALASLQTAAVKDPVKAEPYLAMGRLHKLRDEKAAAFEAYRQALHLNPLSASAVKGVEELSAVPAESRLER
jgi:spermidine synthase